jgi:hypothetical protein
MNYLEKIHKTMTLGLFQSCAMLHFSQKVEVMHTICFFICNLPYEQLINVGFGLSTSVLLLDTNG